MCILISKGNLFMSTKSEEKIEIKLPEPIKITPYTAEEESFESLIETKRKELVDAEKKAKTRGRIAIFLCFALIVASLFTSSNKDLEILSYILIGSAVVVLIVFMILNKRVARPDVRGYVRTVLTAMDRHMFSHNAFNNVVYDPMDKIDLSEVFTDGVYEGVVNITSRNIVEGSFSDSHFRSAELALYIGAGKSSRTAFVGRYISMPNNLHFNGRFVFNLRGETTYDLPTGCDDLKCIQEEGYVLYAPEYEEHQKIFPKDFYKKLKELKIQKHLLNVNVVVWAGKTILYASYDDAANVVPLYEPLKVDVVNQFKDDLQKSLELMHTLDKE